MYQQTNSFFPVVFLLLNKWIINLYMLYHEQMLGTWNNIEFSLICFLFLKLVRIHSVRIFFLEKKNKFYLQRSFTEVRILRYVLRREI